MANYFVKATGNNGNGGTTWALAKANIGNALALANAAGDKVYVAPGVYNEALANPAANGTSSAQSELIADVDSTATDGDSNTSGVTPGPVSIMGNPTSAQGVVHWNQTNYWTMQGFIVSVLGLTTSDLRGLFYGTYSSPSYGLGMKFHDCVFIGGSYAVTGFPGPVGSGTATEFRRCLFIAQTPFHSVVNKTTAFSATADVKLFSCMAIVAGSANPGFLCAGADGTNGYTFIEATNCSTWGASVAFSQSNSTYSKWVLTRCLAAFGTLTSSATQITATNCYSYHSSGGAANVTLNPTSYPHQMLPMLLHTKFGSWHTPLSYTPTGEDVYDLQGNSLSSTPGALQYITNEELDRARTRSSDRGSIKLWDAATAASSGSVGVHRNIGIGVI